MKKLILTTAALALLSTGIIAQGYQKTGTPVRKVTIGKSQTQRQDQSTPDLSSGQLPKRGCGTAAPTKDWDAAFNEIVETHKQNVMTGRTTATTYTIPIIFHIIHEGEAVGSGHNISQAQVNSQIPVLNADYNGTGYNTNLYSAMTLSGQPAFYQYAAVATNSVAAASMTSTGGIAIGASGVYFCLATKNPSGTTLAEPGIDRQPYTVGGNTTKPSASSNVQSLFDNTIKPATIWDPTKYFNVWVSDGGTSGLLGYATFPPVFATGSAAVSSSQNGGASGNWGMSATSQSTTDGVWCVYTGLGTIGAAAAAPYNKGRTLTHESGHWLGLRHIWGDGTCANDFCNDTPPAAAANYVNCGQAYPYNSGSCTGNAPDGEMYMNFMDYSNDCGMWMFTNDQCNRIHASLAGSAYRSGLTASATNLCAGVTATAPVAGFTYPTPICTGQSVTFTDASSNSPTSYTWTSNPSTGVVITSINSASPIISFSTAGSYSITQIVSNTAGSNSVMHVVTTTTCAATCDTMRNVTAVGLASPYLLWADNVAPHDSGYLAGTNVYGDKAKAEKYTINLSNYQLTAIQVAIHKAGTNSVTFNVWNDNAGVPGTVIASKTVAMSSLTSNTYNTITLATPLTFTTSPYTFYVGFNIPTTSGDTIASFTNNGTAGTAGTGFEQWTNSSWNGYDATYGTAALNNFMFPIVCPIIATGIESNHLGSGINLFPNPNNGQFNFSVSLSEATNLNFTVVNMLGQVVYTKLENNVTNAMLSCDLSGLAKGIYYANITDSNNNRTVKKIIIQ